MVLRLENTCLMLKIPQHALVAISIEFQYSIPATQEKLPSLCVKIIKSHYIICFKMLSISIKTSFSDLMAFLIDCLSSFAGNFSILYLPSSLMRRMCRMHRWLLNSSLPFTVGFLSMCIHHRLISV